MSSRRPRELRRPAICGLRHSEGHQCECPFRQQAGGTRPRQLRYCLVESLEKGRKHVPAMSVLLLVVGVLLGGICAAALMRSSRARMRDALKAISVDVLAQTGESLAQRVAEV